MDGGYEEQLIKWAAKYNGYQRLASSPEHLWDVVRLLYEALQADGCIPEWAGVDLLRGWAFFLVRSHRFSGAWAPIQEVSPEFTAILDAIRRHPGARKSDLPPAPDGE